MTWFVCMVNHDLTPVGECDYDYEEKWFTMEAESKEDAKIRATTILESIRIPCCYGLLTVDQEIINQFWGSFIHMVADGKCGCDICGIPKSIIKTLKVYSLEELRVKA